MKSLLLLGELAAFLWLLRWVWRFTRPAGKPPPAADASPFAIRPLEDYQAKYGARRPF